MPFVININIHAYIYGFSSIYLEWKQYCLGVTLCVCVCVFVSLFFLVDAYYEHLCYYYSMHAHIYTCMGMFNRMCIAQVYAYCNRSMLLMRRGFLLLSSSPSSMWGSKWIAEKTGSTRWKLHFAASNTFFFVLIGCVCVCFQSVYMQYANMDYYIYEYDAWIQSASHECTDAMHLHLHDLNAVTREMHLLVPLFCSFFLCALTFASSFALVPNVHIATNECMPLCYISSRILSTSWPLLLLLLYTYGFYMNKSGVFCMQMRTFSSTPE